MNKAKTRGRQIFTVCLLLVLPASYAHAKLSPDLNTWVIEQVQQWTQLPDSEVRTRARGFGSAFTQESRKKQIEPSHSDLRAALCAAEYNAATLGLWPAVRPLIIMGADPNIKTESDQDTPLLAAARKAAVAQNETETKFEKTILALVQGSIGPDMKEVTADPRVQDPHGNTALAILTRTGKGKRYAYLGMEPKTRKAAIAAMEQGHFVADAASTPRPQAPINSGGVQENPENRAAQDSRLLSAFAAGMLKYTGAKAKNDRIVEFGKFAKHSDEVMDLFKDEKRYAAAVKALYYPDDFKNRIFGGNYQEQSIRLFIFRLTMHDGKSYMINYEQGKEDKTQKERTLNGIDQIVNVINPLVLDKNIEFIFSMAMKHFVASLEYFKKGTADDLTKVLLAKYLEDYYKGNSEYNKKFLLAAFLDQKQRPNGEETLKCILDNAGPVLHKLLQLFSEQSTSERERAQLGQFKSNIKRLNEVELDLARERSLGPNYLKVFPNFNETPLAVASVGQVHMSTYENRPIVIKLKKPFLKDRSDGEFDLLQHWSNQLGRPKPAEGMIKDLRASMANELDFERERDKLIEGAKHYNDLMANITVAEPVNHLEFKDALVMELAKGMMIQKVENTPELLCSKKSLLLNLLKKWLTVALFEDGFIHGDLHGGNIMFNADPHGRPWDRLILLDFGNADTLDRGARRSVIMIITGVKLQNVDLIMRGLRETASISRQQEQELLAFIQTELARPGSVSSQVNGILNFATRLDVPMAGGIVIFNRGRMLIEGQIKELNRQIDAANGVACLAYDIPEVYADTFKEGIPNSKFLLNLDLIDISNAQKEFKSRPKTP